MSHLRVEAFLGSILRLLRLLRLMILRLLVLLILIGLLVLIGLLELSWLGVVVTLFLFEVFRVMGEPAIIAEFAIAI